MEFKLFKYAERFESTCTDADGVVWHEAVWGLDIDPADIKRESLLLAQDAKAKATTLPEEIVVSDPEPVKTKK